MHIVDLSESPVIRLVHGDTHVTLHVTVDSQVPATLPVATHKISGSTTNVIPFAAAGRQDKFIVPTVVEVAEYCRQRKSPVDPQAFVDFYESKGWLVGRTKMRNWQAAVRTWEKQGYRASRNMPKQVPAADIKAQAERVRLT